MSRELRRIVNAVDASLPALTAYCAVMAVMWFFPPLRFWGAVVCFGLILWGALAVIASERNPSVLHFAGMKWTVDDFCRGWLITGRPGTGKTTAAINRMLWEVSANCPGWGGVCVDDKGLYWETLSRMFREMGREKDLILLEVRPDAAFKQWRPKHTYNFLADPRYPASAKAAKVCDVAGSMGQRTEQSFFRTQAQIQIEFAMKALACAELPVTFASVYECLSAEDLLRDLMNVVEAKNTEVSRELWSHYCASFLGQPTEQLGGVKATIANYLKFFTDPDIAEVFCPEKPTFEMSEVDRGKVVCVSIPQRFHTERRYINTLLKLAFYSHAMLRFDQSLGKRVDHNLIILWADEAQRIVTATADGMSDYNVVDVIREARAAVVAATQSYTSLIPPLGDEHKAKTLIANLANRVTFCAADEDSAKIAADTVGKFRGRRFTRGTSGGRPSTSWTEEERYHIEPHEFRKLPKFNAVVQHCEGDYRKVTLAPLGPDGRRPSWY